MQISSKDGTINVQVNDQVNDQVNNQNLSTLFGVSEKAIRRDIYVLRDMNLIHYI
uniref:DeoR family transcriptional regulator n=1 Tax=Prevotella sp. TaxID=59823 RepID=UPI00402506F3